MNRAPGLWWVCERRVGSLIPALAELGRGTRVCGGFAKDGVGSWFPALAELGRGTQVRDGLPGGNGFS